ncbi:MAG: hypothetical protein ABL908_23195, partial [Hyphomicrobium sp.]
AAPSLPGLITDPDDPMLQVVACTGAPACPQALAPTRPLARSLAQTLVRTMVQAMAGPALEGPLLHVSGCAKGCAMSGSSPLTLLAEPVGFALIVEGTVASPPALRGLNAAVLIAHPETLTELLR